MALFGGSKTTNVTEQEYYQTQVTGGQGALSGNNGSIRYNYAETDHGAVTAGLKIAGESVGAVVHLATQQQAAQVNSLNTLQAAFSRQADNFDGSISTIESAAALQKQSLTGVVVLALAVGGVLWVVRK